MQKNTAALFLGTTQHVHERKRAMQFAGAFVIRAGSNVSAVACRPNYTCAM